MFISSYGFRKFIQIFPTLIGITLITFFLFYLAGGDPALQLAGKNGTLEQIESLRIELGLKEPLIQQYLNFLIQTLTLNWGESWHTHENINSMIYKGLGPSLCLTLPAFFVSLVLSIVISLSTIALSSRKKILNEIVTWLCLALMSVSFLVYIIVFQYYLAFKWNIFELNGWDESWALRWQYLFLPWVISILVSLGPNILIFRSALFEELSQNYVRTGFAKGLSS